MNINIYKIFLIIGISIPLVSLLLAPLSGFFDGDFDLDLDIEGGFNITSWLPLSPLTMSTFLIGCGGSGLLIYESTKFHYVFSFIIGMMFFVFFKRIILDNLKKVKTYSVSSFDYIGKQGEVVHKIDKDMMGVISITNENGKITYLAKSEELIEQGCIVEILELIKENNADVYIVRKIH